MRYGELLIEKKIATRKDVTMALETQKKSRLPVGKIAVSLDMVFPKDSERIHYFQSNSGQRFGETGVRLGYLSEKQVETLLAIQKKLYLPIGKIISMEKGLWKEA